LSHGGIEINAGGSKCLRLHYEESTIWRAYNQISAHTTKIEVFDGRNAAFAQNPADATD